MHGLALRSRIRGGRREVRQQIHGEKRQMAAESQAPPPCADGAKYGRDRGMIRSGLAWQHTGLCVKSCIQHQDNTCC